MSSASPFHRRPTAAAQPGVADLQSSFFNVEKTQVRPQTALIIHYGDAGGITGHVMLLCMLLMFTTCVSACFF